MLSISTIKNSAQGAAKYYISEEKNYYLSESSIGNSTEWIGNGAKINGILGKSVSEKELAELLDGKTKTGEVQKSPDGKHRAGWDFTFSAPKSVSILGLVYGKSEIIHAHDNAVKNTIKQIEKDTAQAAIYNKETKSKDFINTDNLTAAMIRHATSREMDPQIHTHVLVCNMTYDHNGKLRALASSKLQKGDVVNGTSERVFRDQKFYTAIYQNHLAAQLNEMGLEIKGIGNGQFNIPSVPDALQKAFSKRREQIEEQAENFGVSTAKGMDVATQTTRKNKSYKSMDELRSSWIKEAKTIDSEFNPENITHISESKSKPKKLEASKDALNLAIEHLSHTQTKISYTQLLQSAMGDFAFETGIQFEDLNEALDLMLDQGNLIPLDKHQSEYTSTSLINKENALISQTQKNIRGVKYDLELEALSSLPLNKTNQKKIHDLFSSTNHLNIVNLNGNSKQLIESLIFASEKSGIHVQVLSQNKAQMHQSKSEIKKSSSDSLLAWLKNHFKPDVHNTIGNHLYESDRIKNQPKGKNLMIISEANKLRVDTISKLIDRAEKQKSKLIFINHDQKLRSHQFGNALETLKEGNVNEIRWSNNLYAKSTIHIKPENNQDIRIKQLSEEYAYRSIQSQNQTHICVNSRSDIKKVNTQLRSLLKELGQLGHIEHSFNTLNPVFLTKEARLVPKNYQIGMNLKIFDDKTVNQYQIHAIDPKKSLITLKDEHQHNITQRSLKSLSQDNFILLQNSQMDIAQGDKIRSDIDIKKYGIQAGVSLKVDRIRRFGTQLSDSTGKRYFLSKKDFKDSAFQYDYAKLPNQLLIAKEDTLMLSKSYLSSSELLETIMEKTNQNIHIFTDNAQKIQDNLAKSNIQPTAINTVIESAKRTHHVTGIDKFVCPQTSKTLQSDLNSAITHLKLHTNTKLLDHAMEYAIAKLEAKEAAFRHQDVISEAIHYALNEAGTPLKKEDIETEMLNLKEKGGLLSADYSDGVRWCSKTAYETESKILSTIEDGKNSMNALADPKFVNEKLIDSYLTDSQKEAIALISTSKDRFIAIQGLAGTGKSTMLSDAIEITQSAQTLLSNEIQFVGLAPTWQVVNELKEKGVQAQTFASFLQNIDHSTIQKNQLKSKNHNTVFLVDESSMMSNADTLKFINAVEKSGSRAIYIGDIEQLPGQGSGKPFELSIRKNIISHVKLIDIIRQNPSPTLKASVEHIIDRDIKTAFDAIESQNTIINEENGKQTVSNHNLDVSKNIVETKGEYDKDPKLNRMAETAQIIKMGAMEYCNRTPQMRANTLFIAYSNVDRDNFSMQVRKHLIEEGTISSNSTNITRLRGIDRTSAALRTMDAYQNRKEKTNYIVSIKDQYYEITHLDDKKKLLNLKHVDKNETRIYNPKKEDPSHTKLWSKEDYPLSLGESIMIRKSDKNRGHIPNVEYNISKIEDKQITLSKENTTMVLDTSNMKDCHWDYAYAKTSDMAQGSTKKYVVSMISNENPLTNIRRAIVDISRATTHAKLITEDRNALIKHLEGKTLQSVDMNHGNKRSALDTIEKTLYDQVKYFKEKTPFENKMISSDSLALETHHKSGLLLSDASNNTSKYPENAHLRKESAQSIYNGSITLKNTLAERYLTENIGISKAALERLNVSFFAPQTPWNDVYKEGHLTNRMNKVPVLIIPTIDKNHEVSGVMRFYLDYKEPILNEKMYNPILAKGLTHNSAGSIQSGSDENIFISSDFKVAFSIADAKERSTVLCTFSQDNIQNIKEIIDAQDKNNIILVGDNSNPTEMEKLEIIKHQLDFNSDKNIVTIYPDKINDERTTYHDVLISSDKISLAEMINKDIRISNEIKEVLLDKYLDDFNTNKSPDELSKIISQINEIKIQLKNNGGDVNQIIELINHSDSLKDVSENIKTIIQKDTEILKDDKFTELLQMEKQL